jgi:ketosteroid isomerase-like protein
VADLSRTPLALTLSFIDAINRSDVSRLSDLMADDYELKVFDEPARLGRSQGIADWRGYLSSFPNYIILPHKLVTRGDQTAVLGTTTGSHLGLPDEEERKLTLIWLSEIAGGKIRLWRLIADTAENRETLGLGG